MSEAEVQALYEQLRKLRGQLPEFLQTLTNLDDLQTSQDAFLVVARALSDWTAETRTFIGSYERLKGEMERQNKPAEAKPAGPMGTAAPAAPAAPAGPTAASDFGFNSLDGGSLDTFGNEFFDLT